MGGVSRGHNGVISCGLYGGMSEVEAILGKFPYSNLSGAQRLHLF